jgi:hypothetical protein
MHALCGLHVAALASALQDLLVSAAVSVGAVFGEHDEQVVVLLLERLVPEQPQPRPCSVLAPV